VSVSFPRAMRRSFVLFLCLSVAASEKVYNITNTWSFNQTTYDRCVPLIPTTTEDSWLYHWGDWVNGQRWAKQGFIDQAEVDLLNKGDGMAGGGFYLSYSDKDSKGYGIWPTAVFVAKGEVESPILENSNNAQAP